MSVTEYTLVHLDMVEAESIYNLREVVRICALADPAHLPLISSRITADLIWMSQTPPKLNAPYLIKHATQMLCCRIVSINLSLPLRQLQLNVVHMCLRSCSTAAHVADECLLGVI